MKKRSRGTVTDIMAVCIYVLAMAIIMMVYLGSIQLLNCKTQISQTARKYILRMETVGYLTAEDQLQLTEELQRIGACRLDFTGSTVNRVDYGAAIRLVIRGEISGQSVDMRDGMMKIMFGNKGYRFEECKMSTAKN